MKRLLGLAFAILFGCSSTSPVDDTLPARNWQCREKRGPSCLCYVPPASDSDPFAYFVPHCIDYSCCIFNNTIDPSAANCVCGDLASADCAAQAARWAGAEVVSQCPPAAEDRNAGACAAQGVSCATKYLISSNLDGCCTGTVCKMSANGVPTCEQATAAEIEHALECKTFARAAATNSLTIANPTLVTSVGTVTFGGVGTVTATLGPNGCVSSLFISLTGSQYCRLSLAVGVVAGKLTVTELSGALAECPGFTGTASSSWLTAQSPVGIDLTVTGDPCYVGDSYLLPGTFDFHIGSMTIDTVTLSDQHLIFQGYVRDYTASAACPTP